MRRLRAMSDICRYFYRVHVRLTDPESESHLIFDFRVAARALSFAEEAFMSCDINKVWVELVVNEFDTTESPNWRE